MSLRPMRNKEQRTQVMKNRRVRQTKIMTALSTQIENQIDFDQFSRLTRAV